MNSKSQEKVFYPLFAGCVEILFEVFHNGRRIDRTLDYAYKKNKKWGAKDRRWVAEQVYTCCRGWRFYQSCIEGVEDWSDSSLPSFANSNRLLPTMHRVEEVLKVCLLQRGMDLSSFKQPSPKFQRREIKGVEQCSDFFYSLGKEIVDWDQGLLAQSQQAPAWLRVNLLKASSREECQKRLEQEGILTELVSENETALKLIERKNVFATKVFADGWLEMQDLASQTVAPLLDPQPGERVIDACAGAGGKTLHLAERMKNKGQIISLDIHEWKLKELKLRSRRAGVHNVETRVVDSQKVIKRLHQSADALLLDVPCTGSGVLRRNPDPKWRLTPGEFEDTLKLQAELMQSYSKMLKPGGRMVYSTCSIFPQENRLQVENFLNSESGSHLSLKQEFLNLPHQSQGDGFYAALLVPSKKSDKSI